MRYKDLRAPGVTVDTRTKEKIEAYYMAHSEDIDKAIKGRFRADPMDKFFADVVYYRAQKGVDTDTAIHGTLNTLTYKTYEFRAAENMLKGLRSDKQAYAEWRRLTGHQKIDKSRIVYEGDKLYSYIRGNMKIFIFFDDSPVQILVWSESLI